MRFQWNAAQPLNLHNVPAGSRFTLRHQRDRAETPTDDRIPR